MLVVTYKALCDLGPCYLKDRLALQISVQALRSAGEGLLCVGPLTVALSPQGGLLGFEFVTVWKEFKNGAFQVGFLYFYRVNILFLFFILCICWLL